MAIMWTPPANRPSLVPTPAEIAWRLWIMQALAANGQAGQGSSELPAPRS
jgi:hypothetical protein